MHRSEPESTSNTPSGFCCTSIQSSMPLCALAVASTVVDEHLAGEEKHADVKRVAVTTLCGDSCAVTAVRM